MPLRTSPRHVLSYYLVCFDESGRELPEDDGTLLSDQLLRDLENNKAVTDVFFISHGWNNDVAGAIRSYDKWIDVMADCRQDDAAAKEVDPNFSPVIIGIHWPSLAFGDESLPAEAALPTQALVSRYGARIGGAAEDVAAVLAATTGINVSKTPPAVPGDEPTFTAEVSAELSGHFHRLFDQSGVGVQGPQASPGDDTPAFSAQNVLAGAAAAGLLGDASPVPAIAPASLGPISWVGAELQKAKLVVLRKLSFWHMKARARTVGESGVHDLFQRLQAATAARFHLMGHSFGCIVMTATICGPLTGSTFPGPARKINSLFLVQGAMSLWSFAEAGTITGLPDETGFYCAPLSAGLVAGPIVTTTSAHDTAVGLWYPLGAAAAGQERLLLPELPQYGGLGAFGIRGRELPPGFDPAGLLRTDNGLYTFAAGQIYNLDASAVIAGHTDIAHPEVAHAFWGAAISLFPGAGR
jgi:hypothetical protein